MNHIDLYDALKMAVSIRVVGIGNGGSNAVGHMYQNGMSGAKNVKFITINTDIPALCLSKSDCKLNIGKKFTGGMGTGGKPEVGERSAMESRKEIEKLLEGADVVLIIAGMGGGTGTGAAPIVAEIASDMGCLSIGMVTRPFAFEGEHRTRQAEEGIVALKYKADALVVVPDERLHDLVPNITSLNGFAAADEVLLHAVQVIVDLLGPRQNVGMDLSDIISVMKGAGVAYIGLSWGKEEGWAKQVAKEVSESPLMEKHIHDAKGILVNFRVPLHADLHEINKAVGMIFDAASKNVNFIWGFVFDENRKDEIQATMIAADFGEKREPTVVVET